MGWPWVRRDGAMAAGSPAGSGAGFGMSQACRASGNPCREKDYVIATLGLWFPASNPAASPSSRRSKLKGRFMLSDPWGGGRLNAGIEAWHGSALLRWSRQPAARPCCCPVLLVPRLCWGDGATAGPRAPGSPGGPRPGAVTSQHHGQGPVAAVVVRDGRPCPGQAAVPLPGSAQPTNPLTAAGERLHQPLCGKMVSSRSGERIRHLGPRRCGT